MGTILFWSRCVNVTMSVAKNRPDRNNGGFIQPKARDK